MSFLSEMSLSEGAWLSFLSARGGYGGVSIEIELIKSSMRPATPKTFYARRSSLPMGDKRPQGPIELPKTWVTKQHVRRVESSAHRIDQAKLALET